MSKLKENLQAILAEKTKIKAEEIVEGKTLFGINGTLKKIDSDEMGSIPTHDNGFGTQSSLSYEENYISIPLGNSEIMSPNDKSLLLNAPNELHGTLGFSAKVMIKMLFQHIGLTADKLVKGSNLFGLEGTAETGIDTSDATATANNIEQGKTAYVNGEKIEGILKKSAGLQLHSAKIGSVEEVNIPNEGKYLGITFNNPFTGIQKQIVDESTPFDMLYSYEKIAENIGLTSDKIMQGNTILGIEGTGNNDIPFEDETEYTECLSIANSILGIVDMPSEPGESETDEPIESVPTP